jgi:plastocyanin
MDDHSPRVDPETNSRDADTERNLGGDQSGMHRRSVLALAGTVTITATAGCSQGGDEATTAGPNDVVVGPDAEYVYEPESLTVTTGDTVTWSWASNNHNIVVESQPDAASWPGTDGGGSKTYDDGYEYSYTFDTPGTYEYFCTPHKSLGMKAEVVVEES